MLLQASVSEFLSVSPSLHRLLLTRLPSFGEEVCPQGGARLCGDWLVTCSRLIDDLLLLLRAEAFCFRCSRTMVRGVRAGPVSVHTIPAGHECLSWQKEAQGVCSCDVSPPAPPDTAAA